MTRDELLAAATAASTAYFLGEATVSEVLRARNAVIAFDAAARQKRAEALQAKVRPPKPDWPKLSNTAIRKTLDQPAPRPSAPGLLPSEQAALAAYRTRQRAHQQRLDAFRAGTDPYERTWMP